MLELRKYGRFILKKTKLLTSVDPLAVLVFVVAVVLNLEQAVVDELAFGGIGGGGGSGVRGDLQKNMG